MPRKFFVGGNWKCNLVKAEAEALIDALSAAKLPENVEVLVAPTFVYLETVNNKAKNGIHVSAQNCYIKAGAFTGEVNINQLKDLSMLLMPLLSFLSLL